jgi:DNA-binding winged helix-turn-helix (wHTH) protein/Flp pilus assembly protein TadD
MPAQVVRFGGFELDLDQRELRKNGARVPLQHKPFRILELLLREPGSLVTRRDLAKDLWPDLHVNFDHGLNSAMNTLRQVLGDSSRTNRFIETRSGLGYRFIAPLDGFAGNSRTVTNGNGDGYQDYLKGRFFLSKMTDSGVQRAIGCFQSALKDDPACALAMSGLADAYGQLALSGTARSADIGNTARDFVASALRADPNLADAHVSLGRLRAILDWDWTGALEAVERAIELDHSLGEAYRVRALVFCALDRHEDALRDMGRAQSIDPLSLPMGYELAWLQYLAGRFSDAVEQSWAVLTLDPGFYPAQSVLGLTYGQLGSHEEGVTECQNACVCSNRHPSALASLGCAQAAAGAVEHAEQTLSELQDLSQSQYVSPYFLALVHMGLGERDNALDSLSDACAERDPLLLWLSTDPRFASIRTEQGFGNIVRRTHGLRTSRSTSSV